MPAPLGFREMIESDFPFDEYKKEDPPLGTWLATLDQMVWGKSAGIHCYFTKVDSSQKCWLFLHWQGGKYGGASGLRKVPLGAKIMLTVVANSKSGRPKLQSLRIIEEVS